MALKNSKNLPSQERKKRKREGVIIVLSLLLIIILTMIEVQLSGYSFQMPIQKTAFDFGLSSEIPLGNHILIFAITNIVILLIILSVYLLARNIFKLAIERHSNHPGAKLQTKLVLAFVGLSLFPTMLLFFVSAGYITTSIQNWFNTEVETSLNESMEVAQTYYENAARNAIHYGRQISAFIKSNKLINDENLPKLKQFIQQKQEEYDLGVVEVFSAQREELVRAVNPNLPISEFTSPSSEDIKAALQGKEFTRVTPIGQADMIRGIVPIFSNWDPKEVVGCVVINYYVHNSLVNKMKEITASYHTFRQLKILKRPITTTYILTLLLITLVIISLSIWFGVRLARQMTGPLQQLAEGTKQIAEGNLLIELPATGKDEMGQLIQSFNKMAADLRLNQLALTNSNLELEERRRYMETVLKHVTAGVISTNNQGDITTINDAAEKLLQINAKNVIGQNFKEVLQVEHLQLVKDMLRDIFVSKKDTLNKQISINTSDAKLTLQVSLALLKDENSDFVGTVVVFDDLTQLIKAQRMSAWREVARRIAHEIKNPLTPIQLSAQRLRKRYLDKFSGEDNVFDQSTASIIKAVDELKVLVDEFSQFARMPAAELSPNNLNEIIIEVLRLYADAHKEIQFRFTASQNVPELMLDRDQIKRVIINLLENAVAAITDNGNISITTLYNTELKMVIFTISDNGKGITAEEKPRLFEPYFSTKKSGTGLGLSIVSRIITDHHGFIRVKDNEPQGACFIIELPVSTTPA